MFHQPKSFRGSALITALFIMTLVAIAATAISLRIQSDIRRTNLFITSDKANLAAQAIEFWAMGRLKLAAIHTKGFTDKIEDMPQTFPSSSFAYPGISIQGQLDDLQSKFNLNNLSQKSEASHLAILLLAVDPKLSTAQALNISLALATWLSPTPQSAIRHPPLVSISEFRLIKGVTAKLYHKVAPYITALPKHTAININSAPLPVLRTLGPGLTEQQAQLIITSRGELGFNSINDVTANPQLRNLGLLANQFTLVSNYFLTTAFVKQQANPNHTAPAQTMLVYTILERSIKNDKVKISIIQKSLNSL